MRRSNLCDYSDTYIVVKGDITVDKETFEEPNNTAANVTTTNASNDNCVSKINGLKIDNAEDLDVVMSMYNLLE